MKMLWIAFSLVILFAVHCGGQATRTAAHSSQPFSHTCRIVLRGTTDPTGSFLPAEFSINCMAAAGVVNNVSILFGKSLIAHITSDPLLAANLTGVAWNETGRYRQNQLAPPRDADSNAPPPERPCSHNEEPVGTPPDEYPTPAVPPIAGPIVQPTPNASSVDYHGVAPDWGIDIFHVPHLQLVDSILSGAPLSSSAPLLQCLNCSFVTVRNLTLQSLQRSPSNSSAPHAYGAARVTGLQGATLHDIKCTDVRGAIGWACLLLQLRPAATVDVRNSLFSDNTVVNVSTDEPAGSQFVTNSVVPSHLRNCCYKELKRNVEHGYGAVLLSYESSNDDTTNDFKGTIVVDSTVMVNNSGGCGAGLAVIADPEGKGPMHYFELVNSNFINNTASGNGGGVYFLGIADALIADDIQKHRVIVNGSSFINNIARNGGGFHFSGPQGINLTMVLLYNSSFTSNKAICSGGGVFLDITEHAMDNAEVAVAITATSVLEGNTAGFVLGGQNNSCQDVHGGGAIYVAADRMDLRMHISQGSSVVSNSAGRRGDGGGIFVKGGTQHAWLRVSERSNVSYNAAAGRGGFMYIRGEGKNHTVQLESGTIASYNVAGNGGFLYMYVSSDCSAGPHVVTMEASTVIGNTAINGSGGVVCISSACKVIVAVGDKSIIRGNSAKEEGGAFWLDTIRERVDLRVNGNSSMSSNWAGKHGGAVRIRIDGNGKTAVLIGGASRILNNNATSGDGGALYVSAGSALEYFNVTDGSVIEGNHAGGSGGALYLETTFSTTRNPSSRCKLNWDASSTLSYNKAYIKGGGAYLHCDIVNVNVWGGSRWLNNTAQDDGGALCVDTAASSAANASSVTVSGLAQICGNRGNRGGSIYLNGFASLDISEGSSISSNVAEYDGGAVFLTQLPVAVRLDSCTINGNMASRGSGGSFYFATDEATMQNKSVVQSSGICPRCAFNSNTVNITVVKATVVRNTAGNANGGVFYVEPHVTCCGHTAVYVNVAESTFIGNAAAGAGGVLALYDASDASSMVVVTNSTFTGNSAGGPSGDFTSSSNFGGALMIWRETFISQRSQPVCLLSAENSSFENNNCGGGSGGAMMLISCELKLRACNFTGNRAELGGGAAAALQWAQTSSTLGVTGSNAINNKSSNGVGDEAEAQRMSQGRRRSLLLQNGLFGEQAPTHPHLGLPARRLATADDHATAYGLPGDETAKDDTNGRIDENGKKASWTSVIMDCRFTNNFVERGFGGALYLYASSDDGLIHIDGCTFTGNIATEQEAGAAFLAARGSGTRVQLEHSWMSNNTAELAGAGALYLLLGANATGHLLNVSMSGNRAATSGGGAIMDVRRLGNLSVCSFTAVQNSALNGNGGALQLHVQAGGQASFTDCSFNSNSAASYAGALLLDGICGSYIRVTDTSMTHNHAGLSGGALYISYASKPSRAQSGASLFGPPPAVFNATASACTRTFSGGVRILGLTFRDNSADQQGGAILLASASAAAFRNVTMARNTACGGGGSLAADHCASLSLQQSIVDSSRTMGTGGGMYAYGCRRILLEDVTVTGNQASLSGGGMAIFGHHGQEAGQETTSSGSMTSSGSKSGVPWGYTSMILIKVTFSENTVLNGQDELVQGCQASGADIFASAAKSMGGALFVSGSVAAVLSQSDLVQRNSATFGAALASTQRCYADVSFTQQPYNPVNDPDDLANWSASWKTLDKLAAMQCWILQLIDTKLPTPITNEGQGFTVWIDDFLASALLPRCSHAVHAAPETPDPDSYVSDHLEDSRNGITNTTHNPAPQIMTFVVNQTVNASPDLAAAIHELSEARFRQLTGQLADCTAAQPRERAQWIDVAARPYPYVGLPPAFIGFPFPEGELVQNSRRILLLQTGFPFNLTAQLYDMFSQRVTLDASPATMKLRLVRGISEDTGVGRLESFAYLDPGLDKSLTVSVRDGSATWTGVTAYAWPGLYYFEVTFNPSLTPYVQVAQLKQPVEVLPCAVGQTLDAASANAPYLTGCNSCPSGEYGLQKDSRTHLDDVLRSRAGGDNHTVDVNVTAQFRRELEIIDFACKVCPAHALCPGGAPIVPERGYWHSAANSAKIHQCPNPKACGAGAKFPADIKESNSPKMDSRTAMLACCQYAWYSSGAITTSLAGLAVPESLTGVGVLLNWHYLSQQEFDASICGDLDCPLFNAKPGDPKSYMDRQCLHGYTGNLCAACMAGYYIDSDFNCAPCPSLHRTIVLGLVSFFGSVALIVFTAVTNLSEGFGQQSAPMKAQAQPDGGHAASRVEVGDVLKATVIHIQYLIIVTRLGVSYPDVILQCQAVFSTVTGAENYLVYSPSCLQPEQDSAGQALIQWLAGILTPCAVALMSMLLWTIWHAYRFRRTCIQALVESARSPWRSVARCFGGAATRSRRRTRYNDMSNFTPAPVSEEPSSASGCTTQSCIADPPAAAGAASSSDNAFLAAALRQGEMGLGTVFRNVQVVALDAAADAHPEAGAPLLGNDVDKLSPAGTVRRQLATSASLANALARRERLTAAASVSDGVVGGHVVVLDGLLEGSPAVTPARRSTSEPVTPNEDSGTSSRKSTAPQQQQSSSRHRVTSVPEDMTDDAGSEDDGLPRMVSQPSHHTAGVPKAPSMLGYKGSLSPVADGSYLQDAAVVELSETTPCDDNSLHSHQKHYCRNPSFDPWQRKSLIKLFSRMSSSAINDAFKNLRSFVTGRSSQATIAEVDQEMRLGEQLRVVLMAAVFILYPSWAHAGLSTFACYRIDDGKGPFPEGQKATWRYGYWIRDMQMECYSGVHLHVYVPIGVVAVLVFCLLPPLATFVSVWRMRGRLNEAHVRKVYGFLYRRYKPRYIWWETVLQLETLALVTVEVLGRGLSVLYQALLLSIVFTLIALVNVSCAPLQSRLLVIMEFMSLATLSMTITLSLYFIDGDALNAAAEKSLAIAIILLNTSLMVFFLYVASRPYWSSAVRKVASKLLRPMRVGFCSSGRNKQSPRSIGSSGGSRCTLPAEDTTPQRMVTLSALRNFPTTQRSRRQEAGSRVAADMAPSSSSLEATAAENLAQPLDRPGEVLGSRSTNAALPQQLISSNVPCSSVEYARCLLPHQTRLSGAASRDLLPQKASVHQDDDRMDDCSGGGGWSSTTLSEERNASTTASHVCIELGEQRRGRMNKPTST